MSLKTYDEYKDSEIDIVGLVPKEYNIVRLKFLCDIKTGAKDTVNRNPDGKYPFYVRSPIVERIDTYSFDGEAILMAGDGVGAGKVFHYVKGKFDYHQRVYNFHNFKQVNPKFIYYYMTSLFSIEINKGSAKSTVDSVRLPMLENFQICYPNLYNQQRIVNYLDKKTAKIDATIAKNKELIQLLEEKRVALINEVVTKGLNPDVAMKDSGVEWIGEIPEHWNVNKLKVLLNNLTDGSHSSVEIVTEGYPYVTVMDLDETNEIVDIINCKRISKEDYDLLVRNGCKPKMGDILFSQIGTIGLVVPVDNYDDYVLLSSVAILTISKNVNRRWLIYFLRSLVIKEQWKQLLAGGAVKRITLQHIANFTIVVPSISEQKQIAKYLDDEISKIIRAISKIKENITLLEEYKTSLIHHVVTGKIDVRGEEI